MTKISIVVPIFHARARISEALESIRQQTYPLDKLETIVLDDGSNDLCVRTARTFLQRHGMQGTVLVADGNYGTSTMLNRGWQAADGEWIQFLDSDDVLAPNKLEVQIRQLSQLPDAICSSWQRLGFSGDAWQPVGAVTTPRLTEPVLLKIISVQVGVLGPTLFRKKSLEAVAGFSDGVVYPNCGHLMLKLWGNGGRFVEASSPSPLYFVRQTTNARTSASNVDLARQHLQTVVVAEAMLSQERLGALTRRDANELGRLCDESLRVLYQHDRAAFQQYWQWLREVVPRYAPHHSMKLKFATHALGYENAAAVAFAYHWIKSGPSWAAASVSRAIRRGENLSRGEIGGALEQTFARGRIRFAGAASFVLIAGLASLAGLLALGQFGGDAKSAHPRLAELASPSVHVARAPSPAWAPAANDPRTENAQPKAAAPVPVPKPEPADTRPVEAETKAAVRKPEQHAAEWPVASVWPREAQRIHGQIATETAQSRSVIDPTESKRPAAPNVERKTSDAATPVPVVAVPITTASIPSQVTPSAPAANADRPAAVSEAAPVPAEPEPRRAPEAPHAKVTLAPEAPTPAGKLDGERGHAAPTAIAEPKMAAVVAGQAPEPGAGPTPAQVPISQVNEPRDASAKPTPPAEPEPRRAPEGPHAKITLAPEAPTPAGKLDGERGHAAPTAIAEPKMAAAVAGQAPEPGAGPTPAQVPISQVNEPRDASAKPTPPAEPEPRRAPEGPHAKVTLAPEAPTPAGKLDGERGHAAPTAIAEPKMAAAVAGQAPEPGAGPTPAQVPTSQVNEPRDASAKPTPPAPSLSPGDREQAEKMVTRGERDLADGNIALARQFFLRAAAANNARGAMLLATTYDPAELTRLRVVGVQADPIMARKWYQRARELGAPEAEERLARLAPH